MGYEFHITRADEWFESESNPIPLDEWLAYVARDPELQRADEASKTLGDGDTFSISLEGGAVWTGWSLHGESEAAVYFWHSSEHVKACAIDGEVLQKMHAMATALGARVFGDEGEEYTGEALDEDDDCEPDPEVLAAVRALAAKEPPPRPRPWWKFW